MGAVLTRFLSFPISFFPRCSFLLPTHPVLSLSPLSPRSVFVPSLRCPASVVSLLVGFALLRVLLCALALLPARVGFGVLSPPLPLSFLLFCMLVVCSPCLFSAFVVSPCFPVVGCGWLSFFPPSLPARVRVTEVQIA